MSRFIEAGFFGIFIAMMVQGLINFAIYLAFDQNLGMDGMSWLVGAVCFAAGDAIARPK